MPLKPYCRLGEIILGYNKVKQIDKFAYWNADKDFLILTYKFLLGLPPPFQKFTNLVQIQATLVISINIRESTRNRIVCFAVWETNEVCNHEVWHLNTLLKSEPPDMTWESYMAAWGLKKNEAHFNIVEC